MLVSAIALVSITTVQKDLAYAVILGTAATALGFAWKQSTNLIASNLMDDNKKLYYLNGPLFFGSTTKFQSIFSPKTDRGEVIPDFGQSSHGPFCPQSYSICSRSVWKSRET
jgi:SulP family sulfate permease